MLSVSDPSKMEKRTRGSNFSYEEKSLLLFLVSKHFDVIENKRTDSTTSRSKDLAWEKVTEGFNADIERGCERSMKQLRICYENIKRKMKRENVSPFAYYSRDRNTSAVKKQVPILPKLEEPENMLVMVNPDMVPSDPYDSSDMNTASCDGQFTSDQNAIEFPTYSSTPIISIQRTNNHIRTIVPTTTPSSGIRILSVDSCAPSSSAPSKPLRQEAEPSNSTPTLHARLSGFTLPSGDVTLAPVIKEAPQPARSTPAAPSSTSKMTIDNSESDPECLRLRRRVLRNELRRLRAARRMEKEQHQRQLAVIEADLRHKEEVASLKRQVLEAKRHYYLSFKGKHDLQQDDVLQQDEDYGEGHDLQMGSDHHEGSEMQDQEMVEEDGEGEQREEEIEEEEEEVQSSPEDHIEQEQEVSDSENKGYESQ